MTRAPARGPRPARRAAARPVHDDQDQARRAGHGDGDARRVHHVDRLYNHLGPEPDAAARGRSCRSIAVQVLAHGMTSPLREMTAAAQAMAQGDYTRRVTASSHDEVGRLADAFNTMAEDLEQADTLRRELVANVSHELRTPVAALMAQLENMVDGVSPADAGVPRRSPAPGRAARPAGHRPAGPVPARGGRGRPRGRPGRPCTAMFDDVVAGRPADRPREGPPVRRATSSRPSSPSRRTPSGWTRW